MSPLQVFIALAMLFLAIIGHVVTSVWWASAITTTLRYMTEELKRLGHQIGSYDGKFYEKTEAKEQVAKRDKEISDVWTEVSKIREKVSILEGDRRAHQSKG